MDANDYLQKLRRDWKKHLKDTVLGSLIGVSFLTIVVYFHNKRIDDAPTTYEKLSDKICMQTKTFDDGTLLSEAVAMEKCHDPS